MKKILLTLIILLTVTGCGSKKDKKSKDEDNKVYKTVRVQNVKSENIVRSDISSGIIDPINEVAEITETGGDVIQINYKNGDYVKAGDVIVVLEDQNVSSVFLSSEAEHISAKSDFETKKINFEKFEKLHSEDLISEDEFFTVRNDYKQSESRLKMAAANYSKAKYDFNNLTMKSKIDGIVTDMDLKNFEKLHEDTIVFTVLDDEIMRIKTSVSATEINSIVVGGSAVLNPEGNMKEYEGVIYEINPVADELTKKYEVRVSVENKERELKKGMYSRVVIETGVKEGVLVPKEAIVIKGLFSYIFIIEEGVAKAFKVDRGYSQTNHQEVLNVNLPDEFDVVVDGQFFLEDRDLVEVIN